MPVDAALAVRVNCVSLSMLAIVLLPAALMLIVSPTTKTFVNCEFVPVTMGDVLLVATVVGLMPSALLSTNSPNISTMPSWLKAFAVLKFAVSRQFGLSVMRVKEEQPDHVLDPLIVRLVRFVGMVNEVKEEQPDHVLVPPIVRLVRLGGRVKEVKEEQPCHVVDPLIVRLVRFVGIVNEVRDEQPYHICDPLIVRLVRLGGRVKEVKEEQPCHVFPMLIVRLFC